MRPAGLVATCLRFTTIALMLAGASIAGEPANAQVERSANRADELQRMVDNFAVHVANQRKVDRARADANYAQLGLALDAWQRAARNQHDFDLMQAWLAEAIEATMPGQRGTLPAIPQFSSPQADVAVQSPRAPSAPQTTPAQPRARQPRVSEELPPAAEPPAAFGATPRQPVAAPSRVERTAEAPVAESTSPWRRHPAATPLKLDDPFVDDTVVPEPEATRVVLRPAAASTSPGEVQVNLAALAARIRGYDRGLKAVEAKLIANRELSEEELLLLTKELETLVGQRKLIDLYLQSLTPGELSRVSTPSSADAVKKIIAQRVKMLRGATTEPQFDEVFSEQPSPALEEIEAMLMRI